MHSYSGAGNGQPREPALCQLCRHSFACIGALSVPIGWRNADAGACQHRRPGCSAPTDTVVRGRSDHRRNFECDDGDLSPPLLSVVVTVTTTFSKWNLQFFQFFVFFLLPEAFSGLKYAENAIAAGTSPRTPLGSSRCSPRSPSRLGSGRPSPYPTPLGALIVVPPDTKSWRRHLSPPLFKEKLRQWFRHRCPVH